MRIDLNPSAMPEVGGGGEAAAPSKLGNTANTATPNADDIAHLSSGSDAVQRLKMQLHTVPDVRQQRVDELSQAISNGTYKISPQGIANTMLAELGRKIG
jgi:negative regulator of flagellin synthesis FlgM